jgi:predicted flap endonuclease-1-like 5' DNA nuclease
MGLFEKLKSFLSSDSGQPPTGSTDPDVTVEREPSAESEHAVKGTDQADDLGIEDEDAETGEEETAETDEKDEPESAETDEEAESDDESTPEPADEPASVEEINGIGPTYADRLASAGIETVTDLRDADPEMVADAAETAESRAANWIEQAEEL